MTRAHMVGGEMEVQEAYIHGTGQQEIEWTPHLGPLRNTGTPGLTLGSELLLGQATCPGPHWSQLMFETRKQRGRPGTVAHVFNASTWEIEANGSR